MGVVKGTAALGALNNSGGSGPSAEITPFKSGTTLKVRIKGTEDIAQYYGYGVFKKVFTFVPAKPAERNERGFITANPTVWDRAAQYYFELAKKASKEEAEKLKQEARKYTGKERYLMGFYDLTQGKDIVIDLSKTQAQAVYETIKEYADDYEDLAFKLSKKGESTSTTVTLTPIVNMKKDLDDAEMENFNKSAGEPFDQSLFDNVLYEADEEEQIENLKKAGFDVSLIGIDDESTPIDESGDDPAAQF